jgi:uroporphyrinogen-III synthase
MFKLTLLASAFDTIERIESFDWIALTSPSGVEFLLEAMGKLSFDVRKLPKVLVCGAGTAAKLAERNIQADAVAETDFGNDGMVEAAENCLKPGDKLLLLRSNLAKDAEKLFNNLGFRIEISSTPLYENAPVDPAELPDFDSAVFASASAVNAFVETHGANSLDGKTVAAIGIPTADAIRRANPDCRPLLPKSATIAETIKTLAACKVEKQVANGAT